MNIYTIFSHCKTSKLKISESIMSSQKGRHSWRWPDTKCLRSHNGKHFISNCTTLPRTSSNWDVFCKQRNFPFKCYPCLLISDLNTTGSNPLAIFQSETLMNVYSPWWLFVSFCRKQRNKWEQASNSTLKGRIPFPTIHVVNPQGHQCPSNCKQKNSNECHYNKQILEQKKIILITFFDFIKSHQPK